MYSFSVKGKRDWVPVRRNVSIKKRSFIFFARESEEACRWEEESLCTGNTEDATLIVELDTWRVETKESSLTQIRA